METTVYLVRHGSYENPGNVFHGRLPGFPLSEEGKNQAQRLAEKLKKTPLAAVYASPLTRAYETARIIAAPHGLTVLTDRRLLDIKSPLQGKPLAYLASIRFQLYRPEFIRAGGERLSEIFARMDAFFQEIIRRYRGKKIAVVSHGDPILSVKFKYLGRTLYTRTHFDKDYLGMGQGLVFSFSPEGKFESVRPLSLRR